MNFCNTITDSRSRTTSAIYYLLYCFFYIVRRRTIHLKSFIIDDWSWKSRVNLDQKLSNKNNNIIWNGTSIGLVSNNLSIIFSIQTSISTTMKLFGK